MFRALLLFAALLLWVAAGQVRAEVCTASDQICTWTAIGTGCTFTGSPCTPDVGDEFHFDNAHVTLGFDLTLTGTGCLIFEDDSSFTIDQTGTPHTLTFADGCTVAGIDDVGLYFETLSEINWYGGFREWGDATPTLQYTRTADNNTEIPIDLIGICNGAARSLGDGNDGLCDADEEMLCLHFSNARNNPNDGGTGDNYLHEFIGSLSDTYDRMRVLSGGDKGGLYDIVSGGIDTVDPYSVCVDITRWHDSASDANPLAAREWISGQIDNDGGYIARKGETCVQTEEDTVITADGEHVSRCWYGCDTGNGDCDLVPHPISKTEEDTECDGSTGVDGDAIHFPDERPLTRDYASGAFYVIGPCISQGDLVTFEAPVMLVQSDNTEDDLGAIHILSNDVDMSVVTFRDASTVKFDGAAFVGNSASYLDFMDCGGDIGAGLEFEDMGSVHLSYLTISGGGGTDTAYNQLDIEGVTDSIVIEHADMRYRDGYAIRAIGTDNGPLYVQDISFNYSGDGASLLFINGSNNFSSTRLIDTKCRNCLPDAATHNAQLGWATVNESVLFDGVFFLGWGGAPGMSNYAGSLGVTVRSLFMRDNVLVRTVSNTSLPNRLRYFDIRGITLDNPMWSGHSTHAGYLRDGILCDVTTDDAELWDADNGASIENVLVCKAHTTNACGAGGCAPVKFTSTSGAATLRKVSVVWDEADTSDWDYGVWINGDAGGDFHFGEINVSGFQVNEAYNTTAIYADTATLLQDHTTFYGDFSVDRGSNAGAGTFTAINPIADFPAGTTPGLVTRLVNAALGMFGIAEDSYADRQDAGHVVGVGSPGIQPDRWPSIAEALMIERSPNRIAGVNRCSGSY